MHRDARADAQTKALVGLAAVTGVCAVTGLALYWRHQREIAKLRSKDRARLAEFFTQARVDNDEARAAMFDEVGLRLVR